MQLSPSRFSMNEPTENDPPRDTGIGPILAD
jgi:hypothetical protein